MSDPRQIPEQDRWRHYEDEKRRWQQENPGSTPAEYEAAVRRIAKACGA